MDRAKLNQALTLAEYISHRFEGSQKAFAEAQNVAPAQVTQWLKKDFIVVNDVLYSARRALTTVTLRVKKMKLINLGGKAYRTPKHVFDSLTVGAPFDQTFVDFAKESGAQFDSSLKTWTFPSFSMLEALLKVLDDIYNNDFHDVQGISIKTTVGDLENVISKDQLKKTRKVIEF